MNLTRTSTRTSGPLPQRPLRRLLIGLAVASAFPAQAAGDLTTMSLEQLLQMTVVGASKYEQKQSEVAAAVSVITRDEIRSFGWRTLEAALASLPGIHTANDRQYVYLGTRGFGLPGDYTTRVLLTINGNRVNDPTYDSATVERRFPLDMDIVERIEFIPGPGGAVYGQNAMFGVINVVTRQGSDVDGGELAAAYQRPQALREGRASGGKRFDNGLDALVSVSGMRSRGEDRFFEFGASGISGVAAGLDGGRDREFYLRLAKGGWSFEHVHGDNRKDDPTGAFLADPLVPGQYQGDRYALTQLQYQGPVGDGGTQVSARLFAGSERYTSTLIYGTPFAFPASSDWYGVEGRLLYTAIEGHKLLFGFEAQDNRRYDQAALDLTDPANDVLMPGSGYRAGVYVQDEWTLAATLAATLGLRVDRSNVSSEKLSPRAALIWNASDRTNLKLLYGRAHRAPNAYERDYDDGFAQVANRALRGESIDTFEVVADHRVNRDLALRASVYRWKMRNLITLGIDSVSGLPQYQSGDTVDATGTELSFDQTWSGGARLRGSLSLQDLGYAGGAQLLNAPERLAKLNASAPLPGTQLRFGYEWRYDSRRLTRDGSYLGGHAISNLHLTTDRWLRNVELTLGIGNLFDKRYAHPAADSNWQNALEQDGRSWRIGLNARF